MMKRKLAFCIIVFCSIFVIMEFLSFFGIKIIDKKLHLATIYSYFPPNIQPGDLYEKFLSSGCYDPYLGWDSAEGIRGRPSIKPAGRRFAAIYGDSMAYCSEVSYEESWPFFLEKLVGKEFLNMGVEGFGTDQSLLKFEKYSKDFPARYIIFGILSDDINRLLLVVPNYRWRNAPLITKPRFRKMSESIKFIENPVSQPKNYYKLLNPDYLCSISKNDEYYNSIKRRYGFDSVYGRSMPYTFELIQTCAGVIANGQNDFMWGSPQKLYEDGSEALDLMKYIIDRLNEKCANQESTLIIMLHCDIRSDFSMQKYLASFKKHIRDKNIMLINICDILWPEMLSDKVNSKDLLALGGHYSPKANQIIAENLVEFFSLLAMDNLADAQKAYYEKTGVPLR